MTQYLGERHEAEQAPAAAYADRLVQRRQLAASLQRRNLLLSYLRLLWALLFAALLWYVFGRHALGWPWLLLPCLAFGITARLHTQALAAAQRAKRAIREYELGLARMEDRWSGLQPRPVPQAAEASLYAADLDLFGSGSLFELLCTARSTLGEQVLADWLLAPADLNIIAGRQAAVQELRDWLDLRETVASASEAGSLALDRDTLAAWGGGISLPIPPFFRWLCPMLAVLTVAAAVWWATGHTAVLLSVALLLNGTLTFSMQARFRPLFAATEQAARPLQRLAALLATLESERFQSPVLLALQNQWRTPAGSAATALRRLAQLAGAVEQRANFLARLLDFALLYSLQLALLVETWRRFYGNHLGAWLDAFGEMEALLALSTYHYEHPEDTFPQLTDETVFGASALGHPLLPKARCIRNDVALDRQTQMLIVSGSNMSGKSTLLRATGVACVMAAAGAPVRAHRLTLGSLRVAASIQVQDSLQGGRSRFYAEILRLRAVCELARTESPILFLLDELLAGTNSQDRLAGASGVVASLLRSGALGMLSTHDLALTELGPELQAHVRNVHFEDRIGGEGLQFDYTLREGIITRSNGLDLMRLIGLEV